MTGNVHRIIFLIFTFFSIIDGVMANQSESENEEFIIPPEIAYGMNLKWRFLSQFDAETEITGFMKLNNLMFVDKCKEMIERNNKDWSYESISDYSYYIGESRDNLFVSFSPDYSTIHDNRTNGSIKPSFTCQFKGKKVRDAEQFVTY